MSVIHDHEADGSIQQFNLRTSRGFTVNVADEKDDGIPSLRVPLVWLDELGTTPATATQLRIMLFLRRHADAFGRVSRNFIEGRLSGYSFLGRGMQPCDLREQLQVKKSAISEAIKQLLHKGLLAEKRTAKRGYIWIIYPRPGAATAADDVERPEPDDASTAQPVLPGLDGLYDPQSSSAGGRVQDTAIPCGRMGERELDAAPAGGAFDRLADEFERLAGGAHPNVDSILTGAAPTETGASRGAIRSAGARARAGARASGLDWNGLDIKDQSNPNQETPVARANDAPLLGATSVPTDIAVALEDLTDPDRLLTAFHDAVAGGIVRECELHLQLWFEAACHAVRWTPTKRGRRVKAGTPGDPVDRVNLFRKFVWKIERYPHQWWVSLSESDEAARWRKAALEPAAIIPSTAAQNKPRIMPARLKLVMDIAANAIEGGHDARGNIACSRAAKVMHLSRDEYFAALDEADAWFASETDQAGESFAGPITDAAVSSPPGSPRC